LNLDQNEDSCKGGEITSVKPIPSNTSGKILLLFLKIFVILLVVQFWRVVLEIYF
jgi:hypothetical protein